jgi:DNA-directed RNA polymerase subunit beta
MPHRVKRRSYARLQDPLEIPDLVAIQRKSYEWFLQKDTPPEERKDQGLQKVFKEIFPIYSFNEKLVLEFVSYTLGEPKYSEDECRERDMTYAAPLRVKLRLIYRETGEIKEQEVFMRNIPLMTKRGTFIINGAERVIVSQIHRSPGCFYSFDSATRVYSGKIIPYRGVWIEFEVDPTNIVYVRLIRRRRFPITILIRAFGYSSDEEILELFYPIKEVTPSENLVGRRLAQKIMDRSGVLFQPTQKITKEILECIRGLRIDKVKILDINELTDDLSIINTLGKDDTKSTEEALIKIYNIVRPGESTTIENARSSFQKMFFDPQRYDLGKVGRYKINQKFGLSIPIEKTTLTPEDIIAAIKWLVKLNHEQGEPDDIDHLGNRRVRSVGELLQNQLRIGLARLERRVKERMALQDPETATPQSVMNIKPVTAVINEFFGSSQLSQFMDQTNPLAELTHKRRLSALGQGGLSKQRAGFEVRDVHYTHYGRICPIETPEGPNIGLIVSLSIYARTNEFGFIETPYRKVKDGKVLDQIDYLSADEEERYIIAQAGTEIGEDGRLLGENISARFHGEFPIVPPEKVQYMDVSHKQLVGVSSSLIPFLEHDDANRALMGANMQRQAVSLLRTEAPLVGTGMEHEVALHSGAVIVSEVSGVVTSVTADEIVIRDDEGCEHRYKLAKFQRSNQGTCINQKPMVRKGERVKKGEIITEGTATYGGELALGRNILVAFMPWEGFNFEDAIIISEELLKQDILTSIHIEKFEIEARDTQLGPEVITRDIPNLGEDALRNLDERGIVRIGATVKSGDILVGKVTPKGETELSPEYKLLHSIFGEKAREVRDTSLRVPYGKEGIVIDVKVFLQKAGDEVPPGVEELVKVYVANKRKISVGDKMAGRHGNKGVVAKILPREDMPYLPDGTPVELILNPLSVPSRMNIGQILETHLGWAANKLNIMVASPVFTGATEEMVRETLREAGLPEDGKVELYDGRTGEKFDQKIVVGYIYMMKLAHLVEDKIHARSTGPYSLVTQQPLGGKAQFGGQRLGEMEVWALEAYGASYTLQELLTVKSDDIVGRAKIYEAIIKGKNPLAPGIPESFNVLASELQGLCLDIRVLNEKGEPIDLKKISESRKSIEEVKGPEVVFRTKKEL